MLADFPDQLWNLGPISIAASGIKEIEKMPRLVRTLVLSMMLVDKSFQRFESEGRTCSMTGAQDVIVEPS